MAVNDRGVLSRRRTLLGCLLFGVALLVSSTNTFAVSSGGIGGRPAHPDPNNPRTESIFIYSLNGGEAREDQVVVSNNSDKEATVELYAVDGVTTNTGAYTCRQKSEARTGIGDWLHIAKRTITLKPTESEKVNFTLKMPESADVGEHNGCIVFENVSDDGEMIDGGAVRLRTRQAVRVVATIPGELHRDVAISNFRVEIGSAGSQSYTLALKNSGNVSADVDTAVRLVNMFGTVLYENGGGYPVFANQKLNLNFTNQDRPFWGGWYRAYATVAYDKRAGVFGTNNPAELIVRESGKKVLFIAPSPLAFLIILTPSILLLVFFVRRRYRRVALKRVRADWGVYVVQAGDTIDSVARKYSVGWQKLASVNGIGAPYSLQAGRRLRVPVNFRSQPHKTKNNS